MKVLRLLVILFTGLIGWMGFARGQFIEPVKWSFSSEELDNGEHQLSFFAAIDEGWHVYSHYIEDGGPIATGFFIDETDDIALLGNIVEDGEREEMYDEMFEMDLAWFSKAVTFIQKVKLTEGLETALIEGELEFMVCNDRECLPPEYVPFKFTLNRAGSDGDNGNLGDDNTEIQAVIEEDAATAGEIGINLFEENFQNPVGWSYRVTDAAGGVLRLEWKAHLDEGWHIYSQFIEDDGPIPTSFYIDENPNAVLVGTVEEVGEKITMHDDVFDMELSWFDTEVIFTQQIEHSIVSNSVFNGALEFMVCDDKQCLPPEEVPFEIDLSKKDSWIPFGQASEVPTTTDCEGLPDIMCDGEFEAGLVKSDCTGHESNEESKNYLLIFLLGFGGGFIALLTPCVFPMIPLTVSFFTKGATKASTTGVRNAVIYGLSIIVIYVSLGLIVTLGFGPEMLNWIATDPIFNVFFFLIFVFFAISFFGYFELTLPGSWTNKTDQIASRGGLIGIFFMAFTLALVSFSCTGPIIGSLIVEAVRQGVLGPFFGMLGFAVALALPFTLFAIFPRWLNSLPSSGGWLNTVKVFLGFLELAFALKFLSTADLTRHWGILKYELFVGLWIIIFLLLGLYLIGLYRFPHDSKGKIGMTRKSIGLVSIIFSAYLAFGVVNQKPLLSGIAPAPGYSLFNPSKCPIGVNVCYHDYEEGMAYARENNKPVMLDFTGYGCVNCRLMENNVWTDEEVNQLLNEYVIISLYVDDRSELPATRHYVSTATGRTKEIKKVGKYWHDFQFRHFGTLSQPYYVLVGPNKEILNKPVAFSGKQDYLEFLECGLHNLKGVCPECTSNTPVANN